MENNTYSRSSTPESDTEGPYVYSPHSNLHGSFDIGGDTTTAYITTPCSFTLREKSISTHHVNNILKLAYALIRHNTDLFQTVRRAHDNCGLFEYKVILSEAHSEVYYSPHSLDTQQLPPTLLDNILSKEHVEFSSSIDPFDCFLVRVTLVDIRVNGNNSPVCSVVAFPFESYSLNDRMYGELLYNHFSILEDCCAFCFEDQEELVYCSVCMTDGYCSTKCKDRHATLHKKVCVPHQEQKPIGVKLRGFRREVIY